MAGAPNEPARSMIERMNWLRLLAHAGVGAGQRQAVQHPAGAGADAASFKPLSSSERRRSPAGPRPSATAGRPPRRRSRVPLRLAAGGGEVVPEDERPAAGFGNQADRHAGSDHSGHFLSELARLQRSRLETAYPSTSTIALMTPVSGLRVRREIADQLRRTACGA